MSSPKTPAAGTRPASDRTAVPMAIFLWVLVVIALAFGVFQTLTKVAALFS